MQNLFNKSGTYGSKSESFVSYTRQKISNVKVGQNHSIQNLLNKSGIYK